MTPGEQTREFYREQGRQQERQRMTETEAIRENYNLGVLAGEARERQRIIKLLEDESLVCTPENPNPQYDYLIWCGIREQLIALIKGENK